MSTYASVSMAIQWLLNSIEGLFAVGFAAGLIIGAVIARPKLGCLVLLIVPIAMFAYVAWWQSQNPDKLRSTSSLQFVFGPLWPSLGALAGYYAGPWLRSIVQRRR